MKVGPEVCNSSKHKHIMRIYSSNNFLFLFFGFVFVCEGCDEPMHNSGNNMSIP